MKGVIILKKFLKKSLAMLLVIVFMLSAAPLSGFVGLKLPDSFTINADAETLSGTCGVNAKWSLNTSTGVLSITGTGPMYDYTSTSASPFWSNFTKFKTVNIGSGITSIGDYAFSFCAQTTKVTISNTVKTIGDDAFSFCQNLTSISIPDSVTHIGNSAFYCCKRITSINIPSSVVNIDDYAFGYCTSLKSINVNADNLYYSSDSYGVLFNKSKTTLFQYPNGRTRTSYTVPNTVKTISPLAFSGCDTLSNVSIPSSVTSIGAEAFRSCDNLSRFTVDETNSYYSSDDYGVLFNKNKTTLIQYPIGNSRSSYTVPDSVTTLEDWSFTYCIKLTSVNVGKNTKTIGKYAFSDCKNLTTLTIPDNVTNIELYAFNGCNIQKLSMGSGVEVIGDVAFTSSKLTSIILGNKVKTIGDHAFSCSKLDFIHVPPSVTQIGEYAFEYAKYICSTTEDCYAKKYADANGIEFKKCNGHSIAVFSTNKSFTVEPGESMGLAFGYLNGDKLDGEWKKMAITVSDPTVVSLSDYKKTDYGYSIDVIGKKTGQTNMTITDTETGHHMAITVTVSDNFSKTYSYDINNMPSFYPNNKHENDIQTNIYNVNGIYINNFSSEKNKATGKYKVSFDAYNEQNHIAAVDIYGADGQWINCEKIDKYVGMSESIYDIGEEIFFLCTDWKYLTYTHPMHSQKTKIEFEVPDGGYFEISNNFASSPGCYLFNAIDAFFTGLTLVTDIIGLDTKGLFEEEVIEKVTENDAIRDNLIDIYMSSIEDEVRKECRKASDASVSNFYSDISVKFEDFLRASQIDLKEILTVSLGLGETVFTVFSGPISLGFDSCFLVSKGTNAYVQAIDMGASVDKPYVRVYTNAEDVGLNHHGVFVDTNGNIDLETELQVFRISNDDSVKVILNSDNPLEMHELYNISFVKEDQNVQPNGKVKVHVPIPEGMDTNTAKIYRQESDGSWTILNAKIEDNYLVFETDHFSLYAIIGDKPELKITAPPIKQVYKVGENLDTSGMSLEINGNDVSSGFFCSPSVAYKAGPQEITVTYAGVSTTFVVNVLARRGDVNGDGRTNSSDALLILQYSVGKITEINSKYADANHDGRINSSDALIALQISVGSYNGELWFDLEDSFATNQITDIQPILLNEGIAFETYEIEADTTSRYPFYEDKFKLAV